MVDNFENRDDVLSKDLLATIIFTHSTPEHASTKPELDDSAFEVLKTLRVSQYKFGGSQKWSQEPYFVEKSILYKPGSYIQIHQKLSISEPLQSPGMLLCTYLL